jgi:hypothetical protein
MKTFFNFGSQTVKKYTIIYVLILLLIISLVVIGFYRSVIFASKNNVRAPPGSCFVSRNGTETKLEGTCGYLPMYVADFNGMSSYIILPYLFILNQHSFTITLWVWFNENSRNETLFYGCEPCSSGVDFIIKAEGKSYCSERGCLFITKDEKGTIHFSFSSDDLTSNASLSQGKWWFLTFTWNSSTKQKEIFINGKLDSSGPSKSLLNVTFGQTVIGSGKDTLNGLITNVQVYDRVLSAGEILYLYQRGLGAEPVALPNLVGWWPLNGDAKDYSGNSLHGIANVTFIQNYVQP